MAKSLNHTTVCNWRSLAELEATGNPPTPHRHNVLWWQGTCLQVCCDEVHTFYNPSPCIPPPFPGEEGKFCLPSRCLFKVHPFQRHLWPFPGRENALKWRFAWCEQLTCTQPGLLQLEHWESPCPWKLSVRGKPQPSCTLMSFHLSPGPGVCTWAAWPVHKAEYTSQPTWPFCFFLC